MSAVKFALQQNQRCRRRKLSKAMSAEASPDSKCPICLDTFNNIAYVDLCLHKFCFRCIHEWSKNKAECPLCKQPFNSIYHSIKSEQDFKRFDLRPVDNGSFGTFQGVRFRYRTTVTGVNRQMRGQTSAAPDNGIMFEASTSRPQQLQDRYIRRMMMRLAAKRNAASEGRAVNNVTEQEMINFRRELYRRGVRVRNVRDGGRFRDISAEFYKRNPACLHRLIPWLTRELRVLYGAHGSLVNIVQHIIMSRITTYDMEAGAILEELRPFLQGRTDHFLHEFISFAKAPFNMEAYDQHAVYDYPKPSSNEDRSSNSSVIDISEDDENLDPLGYSLSSLSHSVWDDETPGPSYSSSAEPSRTEHRSVLDSDSSVEETQENEVSEQQASPNSQTNIIQGERPPEESVFSDSDDCVIVSFVKPAAERTPELVQLSSDSEESASEDVPQEAPPLSQHIRFSSLSPAASHSSNHCGSGASEGTETDLHQQLLSKRGKNTLKWSDRSDEERVLTSRNNSRLRHHSKDREQRLRRRSKSRGHWPSSNSPRIPHSYVSNYSVERSHYFSSGQAYTKVSGSYRRKGSDHAYQSYRHYNQDRGVSEMHCAERESYFYSCKSSDRHSHSRSRSRESHRRERRRPRSRTYSSSRSPSVRRKSHHDKPGGKRKYKTRHLEESSLHEEGESVATKYKKKNKKKHHKKSKESSRKDSKSLSVELINDKEAQEQSRRHHKKKKKHKKKSKEHTDKHSPDVITIDSDSDFANNGGINEKCTTVDLAAPDPVD
ncbi:E3 ubiquitin-protein ligase Topors-like [Gouania willdenowi]|uniref:E3 ubiquitin-protein ligase Topors-like n=1 Tax=Gouania willdenowi TaxID=441366 RepID=UPI001056C5AB|nr:E3 ubiquitin-protein ligase Topors-like [Gouania willdenowi]